MKKKTTILLGLLMSSLFVFSQEPKKLSLKEVVELATTKSNQANLAILKKQTAEAEVIQAKNKQYPNLTLSGQYQRISQPNISSPVLFQGSGSGESFGNINQILLGNVNASIPLFNGLKINQNIKAHENLLQAEIAQENQTKENLANYAIALYFNIYKTQQTIIILNDNLKSAQQRVSDFKNLEDNGLLAHNDLLKAQLQASNIELSIEKSKKDLNVLNYKLASILNLDENTSFEIVKEDIEQSNIEKTLNSSIERSDLSALNHQFEASKNQVKIAQGNYFPSVNLIGGYVAADIHNFLTVTNAMNFGVGVSYDLSGIFKNNAEVKIAKSKSEEVKFSTSILEKQINEEVKNAEENYLLAQKQFNVYQKAAEQSDENYRIVKDKYDNGLSSTNDLLEANVERIQASINKTVSQADILQKYYELQYAKGRLIKTIN